MNEYELNMNMNPFTSKLVIFSETFRDISHLKFLPESSLSI